VNWEGAETTLKVILAAIGALLSDVVGGMDTMLYILLYMAIADYITGLMAAYKLRIPIQSHRAKEGINSKIYMFLLIGAAYLVGNHVLHMDSALRDGAIFWYIGKEFISLLENGARIGAPVPKFLRQAVEGLSEGEETK